MSTVLRRPADLDEDLRLMAQEVRDYVEAVLNSLAANVPKVSSALYQLQSFLVVLGRTSSIVSILPCELRPDRQWCFVKSREQKMRC